jgi:hypothetical protein
LFLSQYFFLFKSVSKRSVLSNLYL